MSETSASFSGELQRAIGEDMPEGTTLFTGHIVASGEKVEVIFREGSPIVSAEIHTIKDALKGSRIPTTEALVGHIAFLASPEDQPEIIESLHSAGLQDFVPDQRLAS